MIRTLLAAGAVAAIAAAAPAPAQQRLDDRPAKFVPVDEGYGYTRRVVDIPMRDGVKLHTVIAIPKGATRSSGLGMLMTRTPYDAEEGLGRDASSYAGLPGADDSGDDPITAAGYIRVFQDVRGMHGSKGIYIMNPAPAGSRFNPTKTDDSTDAYDTIDWLVKNVKESNGRVGVIGISYDGFLPLMALVNPHPALKVAVPMNPMVDGWRGDDWFHNGAFRQQMMPYVLSQEATADAKTPWVADTTDAYDYYLKGGSAGAIGKAQGLEQLGFWRKITEHPAYDSALAGSRDGQDPRAADVEGADDAGRRAVGSGGYLRRACGLQGDRGQGHRQRHGLSVDGALVSRPGGRRRRRAWRDQMGCRHRQMVASHRPCAVPRALSAQRCAGDGGGTGDDLSIGRQPVAAAPAAERGDPDPAVSEARRRARLRRRDRRGAERRLCVGSRRPGRLSRAPGEGGLFDRVDLAAMAGRRPAHRLRAARRRHLRNRGADRTGDDRGARPRSI